MKQLFSLFFVMICWSAQSQLTDSNYLDLGRTQLKKDFVQSIMIRGADLEKFPYSNLSELISGWLYGMNTNINTLVFVVDGNMVTDVNVYSIQDIEEVRLVQNALAQLNGAFKQQQLVLIKTRKASADGLKISGGGQTHLVTKGSYSPTNITDPESNKNLYHAYQVGGRYRSKRLNIGASLGYLHDVMPEFKRDNYFIRSPRQIDRYRVNTDASLIINNRHEISGRFNLTRQDMKSELSSTEGPVQYHEDQYGNDLLWNAEVKLRSKLGKSFTNELSAAYAASNGDYSAHIVRTYAPTYDYDGLGEYERDNILARNTIRYSSHFGNWELSPAVNFSFRHIRYRHDQFTSLTSGGMPQLSQSWSSLRASQFLLTPSVDLSYRNFFDVQAGIVTDLSSKKSNTVYPYISTAIDLLAGLGGSTNEYLKVFASYAKAGYFYDHSFPLTDVYYFEPVIPMFNFFAPYIPAKPDSGFYNLQLGTGASIFHGRLQFSYQFEKRDFISSATVEVMVPGSSYIATIFPGAVSTMHRVQLGTTLSHENFKWTSGLHFNNIAVKFTDPVQNLRYHDITGYVETSNRSWAGGWNNRFAFKNLSLGFDLVALISKEFNDPFGSMTNENLFSLQQAFIAYNFRPGKSGQAEVFLSTRNAIQNDWHTYTQDPRSYYGAGFKIRF